MAITNTAGNFPNGYYVPTLYEQTFLAKFYATSVCNVLCNTDYEDGLLSFGATVNIRKVPNVVVNASTNYGKINWQNVQDQQVQLTINYAYDAAVIISNIDFAQMDVDIQGAIVNEMANRLRIQIETVILTGAYSSATTNQTALDWRTTGSPGNPTKALTQAASNLWKLNIPGPDRVAILSPDAIQYLLQEPALYALNAGNPKGALVDGYVGEYAGFSLYQSNLMAGTGASATPYNCYAAHRVGITMATQFTNFETDLPLQDYHGKGIRCQNCFGYLVAYPDAVVRLQVQTAA